MNPEGIGDESGGYWGEVAELHVEAHVISLSECLAYSPSCWTYLKVVVVTKKVFVNESWRMRHDARRLVRGEDGRRRVRGPR